MRIANKRPGKKPDNLTPQTQREMRRLGWEPFKVEYWLPSFREGPLIEAVKRYVNALTTTGRARVSNLQTALESVEGYRPGVRKDLLGFIDFIGLGDGVTVGIQVTTFGDRLARIHKIKNTGPVDTSEIRENALRWLRAGNLIEVWGWRRENVPTLTGGTKIRWAVTRDAITLETLEEEEAF